MRRLLAIAVPAVLLLFAPASAGAKGIAGATVCGADGCREIHDADPTLLEGGAPADGPARAGGPLAPEVFDPAASPAAASADGFEAWWLVVPAAVAALAAMALLARRRRGGSPSAAAGAVGTR